VSGSSRLHFATSRRGLAIGCMGIFPLFACVRVSRTQTEFAYSGENMRDKPLLDFNSCSSDKSSTFSSGEIVRFPMLVSLLGYGSS